MHACIMCFSVPPCRLLALGKVKPLHAQNTDFQSGRFLQELTTRMIKN